MNVLKVTTFVLVYVGRASLSDCPLLNSISVQELPATNAAHCAALCKAKGATCASFLVRDEEEYKASEEEAKAGT